MLHTVREAHPSDCETIVEFNRRLAIETEAKVLAPDVLRRGVAAAIDDPAGRIRYWIAEAGDPARPVAQAGVTREWSDWRSGWIWWLQSVYVDSSYRGRGIFRSIFETIRQTALADPNVIGLRLYVEESNRSAQQTYKTLGMQAGGYFVLEQLWTSRFQDA